MNNDDNESEFPVVNNEICIGCGVCASSCPNDSLTMSRRSILHVPPKSTRDKFLQIAQESKAHQ